MATTLATVARSNLGKHRLRFALTSLGIAISAFFLTAVLLLNYSAYEMIRQEVAEKYSTSDVVVETNDKHHQLDGTQYEISQKLADELAAAPQVTSAWKLVQSYAVLDAPKPGSDKTLTHSIIRADLPPEGFLPYQLTEGRLPTAEYEILIPTTLADLASIGVGSTVSMEDYAAITTLEEPESNLPRATYTVTGIYLQAAQYRSTLDTVYTPGELTATYAQVSRQLYGSPSQGLYDQVLLTLASPIDQSLAELQDQFGTQRGLVLLRADEQIEHDLNYLLGDISTLAYILLGFGALSLLMSAFIIGSTYKVYTAARSRELGLLRTLGATRYALVRMLLLEAALLGVLSSLAGIVTAYAIAALADDSNRLSWTPWAGLIAAATCATVTVLAALKPAWALRSVSPMAALTATPLPASPTSRVRSWWVGAVILALGVFAAFTMNLGLTTDSAGLVVIATIALATALVLISPYAVLPLLALLRALASPFSTAALAHSNIAQSPAHRTATVRMVFLCAALVSGALTGYSVLNASFQAEIDARYPYDVETILDQRAPSELATLRTDLMALDQVAGTLITPPQGYITSTAGSGYENPVYSANLQEAEGVLAPATIGALTDRVLVVSQENLAAFNLSAGQTVTVTGHHDSVELTVIPVAESLRGMLMTSQTGQLISGQELVAPSLAPEATSLLHLQLAAEVTPSERVEALRGIAEVTGIEAGQLSGVLTQKSMMEDNMRNVLWAILILLSATLLISLIGLANIQVLSTNQRRHSYALLRVNGLSSLRLRAAVSYETLLLSALALIMGSAAGLGVSLIFLQILDSAGLPLVYALTTWHYLAIVGGGLALCWLAVYLPARAASRISPVAALQEIP
ncbi:FtsX-like permease family protein [Rothia nasimurium]|uniref:ABC transporter permease n=1 Tax=Rothia nasimurium TaxID=85336 RepID=UPI003BA1418D